MQTTLVFRVRWLPVLVALAGQAGACGVAPAATAASDAAGLPDTAGGDAGKGDAAVLDAPAGGTPASDTGPVASDSSERSAVPVSFHGPSPVLTAMPAAAFFGSSTLHLSKNGDGSISVLSDGRSVSLLRGLDPALVNPAVLPFLFPSCDVPVSPVGVSR